MLFLRKLQRNSRNNLLYATLLLGAIILLTACKKEDGRAVIPIAHTETYDIWPDSLDMHGDVILRAMSDSLMLVRVEGNNLDSIKAGKPATTRMTFSSTYPLLDFLYRLEAAMPSSGRYTSQTPYEIYLNPLQNDSARIMLESRIRNGLVLPFDTHSFSWPVVNNNAEWLLAATELAIARGENRWLKSISQTARAVIDTDLRINYNPTTHLFTGLPRYIASMPGIFPSWMDYNNFTQLATFSNNISYCIAMKALDIPCDSLLYSVKRELWLPDLGRFGAISYGIATSPITLPSGDNLAQSIGIISGLFSDAITDAIIRKTPMSDMGITLFEPSLPVISGKSAEAISPSLLQTAWAIATARSGNQAAYSAAVGSLLATEGQRLLGYRNQAPSFRSSITALILRGFLGAQFSPEGLSFKPNIPENLPGEKYIGNLTYRNCKLNIKIEGTGDVISTFTLDGEPTEPYIDATLSGEHNISIALAGPSDTTNEFSHCETPTQASIPPLATWDSGLLASLQPGTKQDSLAQSNPDGKEANPKDFTYTVYINGLLTDKIAESQYQLSDVNALTIAQFCSETDNLVAGFSSEPHLCLPAAAMQTISAADIAGCGTKLLKDKMLAENFVESNRFHNRNLRFDFTAPSAGQYLIDIHYVNGLGIVNSQHKLALRRLKIEGREQGVFLFQQKSAANAPKDSGESWQTMTTWTNTVTANMQQGENRIEILYFQPSPIYADPNANVILVDAIRLIPLN
jgi:hypothetical protein